MGLLINPSDVLAKLLMRLHHNIEGLVLSLIISLKFGMPISAHAASPMVFLFVNSMRSGCAISDNLGTNLPTYPTIPKNRWTPYLSIGTGISRIA